MKRRMGEGRGEAGEGEGIEGNLERIEMIMFLFILFCVSIGGYMVVRDVERVLWRVCCVCFACRAWCWEVLH